jgi:hypothetical protein
MLTTTREVREPIRFEQASELFNSIQDELNDPHFAVCAPVADERQLLEERCKAATEAFSDLVRKFQVGA